MIIEYACGLQCPYPLEFSNMILTAIAAVAQNGVIGNNNDLIWHLPDDLKHFKNLTKGHTIIMGRKTWESIGARPLPHRKHIILTRNGNYVAEGASVVTTLVEALELAKEDDQPFIVGGGEIYQLAMPYLNRMELTIVHHDFEGDVTFPNYNENEWVTGQADKHEADERHAYAFTFLQLNRT
jgi:dihydrofolate reductase